MNTRYPLKCKRVRGAYIRLTVCFLCLYTVELRYNESLYNEVLDLTNTLVVVKYVKENLVITIETS